MKKVCINILTALSGILFFHDTILAQENSLLKSQLKKYEVRFKQLMMERGLPYFEGVVTEEKLKRAMKLYNEDAFGDVRSEAVLLFYHHESDTLHSWLIDHQQLLAHSHQRITVDSLVTLNNTLKFALSVDNMLGLAERSGSASLKETKKYKLRTPECREILSGILLPETIANKLKGKKFLIIIPCLNLSSIPYSLLRPWRNDATLLDSMAFSFAHNFTQLFEEVELKNYPEGKRTNLTKIGKLNTLLVAGSPLFKDSCTNGLSPLPGAERELQLVSQAFNTQSQTGSHASKDAVMAALPNADFIYFATHGWSDTDDPLHKSYIAFYQPGDCGYLTPIEIQKITLKQNPIVILSACQSGLGKIHEAGIIGLARAFLKTGARSVTMSLWNVDDEETVKLMELYVDALKKPHKFSPAEPWRQAVLQYRKQFKKDPLHWAAFQIFGVPYQLKFEVALSH